MTLRKFFSVPSHAITVDTGLFLLRVVVGVAFMIHGSSKIQNPFGWMGPNGFAPPILQALAALSEFGGGLALILGLLTPLASLGLIVTMGTAFFTHLVVRGDPFVSKTGGPSFELALVFLTVAVLTSLTGPGRFSVDRKLFGSR